MKILAVIFDPDEITRILSHLVKIGRAPENRYCNLACALAISIQLLSIKGIKVDFFLSCSGKILEGSDLLLSKKWIFCEKMDFL